MPRAGGQAAGGDWRHHPGNGARGAGCGGGFGGCDRRPGASRAEQPILAQTDGRMATPRKEVTTGLVKGLGLVDSTTLVVGSMIGSGIFIVSADIARQVESPGLLLMVWFATAVLTLIAALSYGELAAAMPHAGGQYVYLRESFGPMSGFLYGWTLFLVIQTGTIAAVAVGFAKFAGVFVPWISAQNHLIGSGNLGLTTQQLVGVAIVGLLSLEIG